MRLREIGLIAALMAGLVLPASAQTTTPTQTTPAKPTVSVPTSSPAVKPGAATSAAKPATQLLDINTASEADLDALPGVGKTRVAKIIKNRPYKGKDELVSKHVLPKWLYNRIKDKIIAKQG
jgi:DNA uptake protein ComE-like DNA-binding protein